MRQKRAKSYKKQINLYLHAFKFREPFQTIIDDELILNCVKASFNLEKGLDRTIQADTKPMITQCCMQALYETKDQIAIDMAKRFERRRCNHSIKDPKAPADCIRSIVDIDGKNKHRYIVASQSASLRRKLRGVPGVPLVFMNRSVMVMEPASEATKRAAELCENAKLNAGLNDAKVGYVEKEKPKETTQERPTKKRKGPSGPNPLSVKKKKTESHHDATSDQTKRKRARRHKKAGENDGASAETTSENNAETSTGEKKSDAKSADETKSTDEANGADEAQE
ncbi:hypothetical protein JCM33374_g5686 [Metschnikowia sp. JCM 33374]|nr:hypothetical protein JCM33374_g5686 [Metschnikowia sp. JCM 33374]